MPSLNYLTPVIAGNILSLVMCFSVSFSHTLANAETNEHKNIQNALPIVLGSRLNNFGKIQPKFTSWDQQEAQLLQCFVLLNISLSH